MDASEIGQIRSRVRDSCASARDSCAEARHARGLSLAAVALSRVNRSDAIETRIAGEHARALRDAAAVAVAVAVA